MMKYFLILTLSLLSAHTSHAFVIGEEVEVYSAPVTGLSCALAAKKTKNLAELTLCPPSETNKGYAVYDITFAQPYVLAPKNIHFYELEKAFGGGSLDFKGIVVGSEQGIPVVEVQSYLLKEKPKAGNFKGCL